MRAALTAIALGAAALAARAQDDRPALIYTVDAAFAPDASTVTGSYSVDWRVPAGPARDTVPLVLYANLYRTPNPAMDDTTWTWCFPRGFHAGGIDLGPVTIGDGAACAIEPHPDDTWPEGTLVQVRLPAAAAPGTRVTLRMPFTTTIPWRFGAFGRYHGVACANGGLVPHVPALDGEGRPLSPATPPLARWVVNLQPPAGQPCVLNGVHHPAGAIAATLERTGWLTLVTAPALHAYTATHDGAHVTFFSWSANRERGQAIAHEALQALRFGRAALGGGDATQVLVDARLRDVFTRHGAGCTLVSDRALRVFPILEKYHHKEIAGEVFHRLVRERAAVFERPDDATWTAEAAAWWLRGRYQAARGAEYREVKGVVGFFSFLPIVDEVRVAPRFPFADVYFDAPYRVDFLREDLLAFAHGTPEGRELAERLADLLGAGAADVLWRRYLGGFGTSPAHAPIRALAARHASPPAAAIIETWRDGRMPVNYRPRPVRQEPRAGGGVRAHVGVVREGGPPALREPVPLGVTLASGARRVAHVVAGAEGGEVAQDFPEPVARVDVDPEARLAETNRGDNSTGWSLWFLASMPRIQIDPNRGRYEVFANVSVVANGDYRNRLTLGGFIEQEGRGLSLGYFRGEGWKRDPTDYPVRLGAALFLEELDESFASTRSGRVNDEGTVASVRCSATLDLRHEPRNPHWGSTAFVVGEWADGWLGTEFRFRLAEAGFAFTLPLAREHVVGAEARFGVSDGLLPTQRLFDAGGEEAVRGLRAGELLGEHRWLLRLEYRHTWLTELQEWMPGLPWSTFTPRRLQGALFVDTGNVSDRFRDLFEVGDTLTSVGYGLRFYMDFAGARYSMVRFEIAYRLDDLDEAHLLFYVGASHSF